MTIPARTGAQTLVTKYTSLIPIPHVPLRPGSFFLVGLLMLTLVGCAGMKPITFHHEVELDVGHEQVQALVDAALTVYERYLQSREGTQELQERLEGIKDEIRSWRELIKEIPDGKTKKDYNSV